MSTDVIAPATMAAKIDQTTPALPITKEIVQKLCVQNGFYRTPSCNEKLYLHHKGFDQIAGLEEFTEAKVVWLEGNAIRRIEGLSPLTKVRQLYLHQNVIYRIEGLEELTSLDGLNISDNYISFLSGLDSQAESLTMLQIKNNRLQGIDGLEHLLVLRKLASLDLTGNRIEDGDALLRLLSELPSLKSLHLTGNPCVRTITNYRKTVLSRLPGLLHLDEKPVFADERRLINAWMAGGLEGEREEKKKMRAEEEEAVRRRLEEFRELTRRGREAQGLPAEPDQNATTDDETDSQPTDDEDDADGGDVWVPGQSVSNSSNPRSSATQSNADPSDAQSVKSLQ